MSWEPSKAEIAVTRLISPFLQPIYRRFIRALKIREDEKIIDFGSGPGYIAKMLLRKVLREKGHVTCVDISAGWLKQAKRRTRRYTNIDYKLGKITEVDIKDNHYDRIIAHFVIHDIPRNERQETINALANKLKKNGLFCIRDPADDRHGLPVEEIRELMENAGLVEIKGSMGSLPFFPQVFTAEYKKE